MEVNLTKIGNSQGVILPKTLITQYGFRERIQLEPREGGLFLSPLQSAEDTEEFWPENMGDDFSDEWEWPIDYAAAPQAT